MIRYDLAIKFACFDCARNSQKDKIMFFSVKQPKTETDPDRKPTFAQKTDPDPDRSQKVKPAGLYQELYLNSSHV
jgi:hypothetical protein